LIIFALFSGATIAGVLGMFIAVPATAVLKILGEYLVQKLAT
jgi:predicted PurR-regulated permease PerM